MFNASMLNPQNLSCINKIISDFSAKPDVVVMAMARAISVKLSMPSSKLESATEYFSMFCLKDCKSMVSAISDIMAFNTQAVCDMTKTMWTVRYKSAYPSDIIFDVPGACSEASFFGYGTAISALEIKFIQENNIDLIMIQNNFARILNELMGQAKVSTESLKTGNK